MTTNIPLGPPPDDYGPTSGEDPELPQPAYPPDEIVLDPAEYPAELLEARAEIEEILRGQSDERSGVASAENLSDVINILGVGIGRATAAEYGPRRRNVNPGQPTLAVYLASPRHTDDLESVIVERMGVRAASAPTVAVAPIVTGLIEPTSHHFRMRPAPGGISSSTVAIGGSGTLGCLATGRSAPRNERTLILSNNHVLANSNLGTIGDCIVQSGTGDGGICASDQVAVLERLVPLSFGGGAVNYVDGATAWAWPDRVSPQMLYLTPTGATTFPISPTTVSPAVGMVVGKSGRTTELTTGTIREFPVSIWVGPYAGGGNAFFAGQIAIEGSPMFSMPGDSGSLVWTWDAVRNPVGLIFSGGGAGNRSFANTIDIVLNSLDIAIIP